MQSKKEDGVPRGPGRLSGSSTVSELQCKKWFSQGIYGKISQDTQLVLGEDLHIMDKRISISLKMMACYIVCCII